MLFSVTSGMSDELMDAIVYRYTVFMRFSRLGIFWVKVYIQTFIQTLVYRVIYSSDTPLFP